VAWILVDEPLDNIYLFQSLLDSVFVLRLAGNVGYPELRAKSDTKLLHSINFFFCGGGD
jgi:hypothetical protein